MEGKELEIAVLGLTTAGTDFLQVLQNVGKFRLTAVADQKIDTAEKVASRYNAQSYDDYRQVITNHHIDLLVVSGPYQLWGEHARAALKKKFPVLILNRPGRNFEDAAELASVSKAEDTPVILANPWRYSSSVMAFKDYLAEEKIENIYLIDANWSGLDLDDSPEQRWIRDPKLAGGGVLMQDAYPMIDMIVSSFGVPEQVYAINTVNASDKQQRLYLTEDVCVLAMRFSDSLIGTVRAARSFGPRCRRLRIYGRKSSITWAEDALVVNDSEGNVLNKFEYVDDYQKCMTDMLADVARKLSEQDTKNQMSTIAGNLASMSVIEAGYLSAKTAMPETPGRILNLGPKGTKDILKSESDIKV